MRRVCLAIILLTSGLCLLPSTCTSRTTEPSPDPGDTKLSRLLL